MSTVPLPPIRVRLPRGEEMACVYIAGPKGAQTPVRVGDCVHLRRHMGEMQRHNHMLLGLFFAGWLPDHDLARKLTRAVQGQLEDQDVHIRGEWFRTTPEAVSALILEVAQRLSLPLVSHEAYLARLSRAK